MDKKICATILSILFFAVLITAAVFGAVLPDTDYSDREQRDLMQHPRFAERESFDAWTSDLDAYLLDQFPLRDRLISRFHEAAAKSGNSVVQDVYVLDTDYLFQLTYPTDEKRTERMAQRLEGLSSRFGIPVVYAAVPQKNTSIAEIIDGLENTTNLLNVERTMEVLGNHGIEVVDLCSYFLDHFSASQRADMYYKSDFHWNDKGGYEAAKGLTKELAALGILNEEELPRTSDFNWVDFSEDRKYMGDLQQRFSDEPLEGEMIPYYELRDCSGLRYYTAADGEEVPRGSIVASEIGDDVLHYNGVCTYNLGYIRIENDNAASDRKVLVLKDSYQNAMTDYLTAAFKEIDIIDPRIPGCDVNELISSRGIDLVLCIYHESNISEELVKFLPEK